MSVIRTLEPKEFVEDLVATLECNCGTGQPEASTGHTGECRIHKAAMTLAHECNTSMASALSMKKTVDNLFESIVGKGRGL